MGRHEVITAPFPVRGVPGGWRDPWDDPDKPPALHEQITAFDAQTAAIAAAWRSERRRASRRQRRRNGSQRGEVWQAAVEEHGSSLG
jgi:hypothetical protein